MTHERNPASPVEGESTAADAVLVADIRRLIAEARSGVATAVNAALTLLYWRVGRRIQEEVLRGGRADYGEQVIVTMARHLTGEFGQSFGEKNLRNMVRFAEAFPDEEIVYALSRQLS